MAAAALAQLMPVDVVTSDFDHGQKTTREKQQSSEFDRIIYIRTMSYTRNVGLRRLLSHVLFALLATGYLIRNRKRYDVVYATAPLNLLAWLAFMLPGVCCRIIDVVDIWPDVLPFSHLQRRMLAPIMSAWKWLFKSAVRKADVVMAVSDEFACEASRYSSRSAKIRRFYIGQERLASRVAKQPVFTIAYVGNIGRLYDFETLLEALQEDGLRERMQLFVIGKGDRQNWLLAELEGRRIQHRYFGVVLETTTLSEILNSCHAGFNGYIRTSASFSYKAVTYLAAGLPLVNSMTGDLERLVAHSGIGENYLRGNKRQLQQSLLRLYRSDSAAMTKRCERFFSSELHANKVLDDMTEFLATSVIKDISHEVRK
jgi:glycosyltransferase involved in cell wall biosynthesis